VSPPGWMGPLLVGLLVVGIGVAFGFNAGYAINPARDLGPRLFTAVAGWGGDVFTAAGGWWWVPVVGPTIGAVAGGSLYDLCITRRHPAGGAR
jgi:glycerol uptake facilitator-like aquaporin